MEKIPKQQPADLIRIVLFGPESTGKTTLSRLLAKHYKTVWVPEYARDYLQKKWDKEHLTCEKQDLIPIAIGQITLENQLAKKANKVLICDTNLLETKVYSKAYYNGYSDKKLDHAASNYHYDLYLLTSIDIPWEADDLRDRPEQREEMFAVFEESLIQNKKPYLTLKGNVKTRLDKAIKAIDALLKNLL